MSLISWNCRGLENPRTVKALQKVVQQKEPILVFLTETKLNKERVEIVKDKCNFKFSWVVPCVGRSGGLALFWKEGIKVEVLEADRTLTLWLWVEFQQRGGISLGFMGHQKQRNGMSRGLCLWQFGTGHHYRGWSLATSMRLPGSPRKREGVQGQDGR